MSFYKLFYEMSSFMCDSDSFMAPKDSLTCFKRAVVFRIKIYFRFLKSEITILFFNDVDIVIIAFIIITKTDIGISHLEECYLTSEFKNLKSL